MTASTRFVKEHWRLALALFSTLGVLVMPFAGETTSDRIGGTVFYVVAAIVFWVLQVRHVRGRAKTAVQPQASKLVVPQSVPVDDAWGRRLVTCRQKAGVFYEVGAATTTESVRGWLSEIADDIATQLVLADDVAALGRIVEPGFSGIGTPDNPAAAEAWSRLGAFESGLDDAITQAAQIRLAASQPVTDFGAIHSQLDMLKSQLPTLQAPR